MTEIEKAEKFIKYKGYGSGTNYTTKLIANLLAEYIFPLVVKNDELKQELHKLDRVNEPWSDEEDAQLKKLFANGTKLFKIAVIHQRSINAINSKLVVMGLKQREHKSGKTTFKSIEL